MYIFCHPCHNSAVNGIPASAVSIPPLPPIGGAPGFVFRHLSESQEFHEFTLILNRLAGVAMSLNTPDVTTICFSGLSSPLCALIQSTPEGFRRCRVCDRRHHDRAAASGKALLYRCHAGFYDLAIPILVQGKHLATIASGQVLPEKRSAAAFAREARRLRGLGIPERKLRAAYAKAPWMPRERLMYVMHLLELVARQMTEHALQVYELQASGELPSIRRARELVEQRFRDPDLTLTDAAKAAGMSVGHFSRFFHKKAGVTFIRYLQSRRIREAKHLLADPDRSISDICFAGGFNSLTHFNRVFRQAEGIGPRQFRRDMRTGALVNAAVAPRPV
jgi:AraC-like DNA-binding protein/ligand-binding sensor protein